MPSFYWNSNVSFCWFSRPQMNKVSPDTLFGTFANIARIIYHTRTRIKCETHARIEEHSERSDYNNYISLLKNVERETILQTEGKRTKNTDLNKSFTIRWYRSFGWICEAYAAGWFLVLTLSFLNTSWHLLCIPSNNCVRDLYAQRTQLMGAFVLNLYN